MPKIYLTLLLGAMLILPSNTPVMAANANFGVVASIKPIHSLVSSIMQGTGNPHLIIKGAGNPHAYNMRPSDAKAIEHAKLVFWIGPQLEAFLDAPLHTLGANATLVELSKIDGLTLLPYREEDEDQHNEPEDTSAHEHDVGMDMHIWLSPNNAIIMADAITTALVRANPSMAGIYIKNNDTLKNKLKKLEIEIRILLAGVTSTPYLTFHDAFQYFEQYYGLNYQGALTLNPNAQLGAKKISQIRQEIKVKKPACIFTEPQYNARVIPTLTEGYEIRSATLDALGLAEKAGPDLYDRLLRQTASSFADCLSGS